MQVIELPEETRIQIEPFQNTVERIQALDPSFDLSLVLEFVESKHRLGITRSFTEDLVEVWERYLATRHENSSQRWWLEEDVSEMV